MTYKAYYKLEKAMEDDPELSPRARRKVARSRHCIPTDDRQKVEVIVEHFAATSRRDSAGRRRR